MRMLCKLFGHKWDEFHCYEVVCSRCRLCRAYTLKDELKFQELIKRRRHKCMNK
jgi:hypothetical protein